MNFQFRKMELKDKKEVLSMMEVFYNSDAVSTNGSKEIFETNFNTCLNNSPYLEGYVFTDNANILGYSMIAKSFSTEFGKPCLWLEDLYLKPSARGFHIIPKFISFVEKNYKDTILRLEVEDYNHHALYVYEKLDFKKLPYLEMKKEV